MSLSFSTVALLVAPGCGEGKPPVTSSTSAEAKVSGKVTIRGKPMKGGEITFNPANYQRPDAPTRTAKVGGDGTYEITTLVGHNSVAVHGPEITKDPKLNYAGQTIDVEPAGSKLDIELPPPATPATGDGK
jgi:hypothetical protein